MLKTFSSVAPYLKLNLKKISTDNFVFKLHYRWTFVILIIATILVSSRQYIGEHIKCITDTIPEHVINTFCFFTTTFTLVRHLNETALKSGMIFQPGIGPFEYEEEPIKRHAYYQWVPFVLFAQAMMFYVTHALWKSWEGGRINGLVNGLKMIGLSRYMEKQSINIGITKLPTKGTTESRVIEIKNAFKNRLKLNETWGSRLIICEILNLLNIMLQIHFTHRFLGRQFYNLGIEFLKEDWTGEMDVLDVIFPKITKCHFHKFGPSGSLQLHDTLCVMALNVINEKIYVILWFWFFFVLIMSALAVIWRIISVLLHKSKTFNNLVFGLTCPGRFDRTDLYNVIKMCNFSNWMFLYFLGTNMPGFLFKQVLFHLSREFTPQPREIGDNEANALRAAEPAHSSTHIKSIDEVDGACMEPLIKEKLK